MVSRGALYAIKYNLQNTASKLRQNEGSAAQSSRALKLSEVQSDNAIYRVAKLKPGCVWLSSALDASTDSQEADNRRRRPNINLQDSLAILSALPPIPGLPEHFGYI